MRAVAKVFIFQILNHEEIFYVEQDVFFEEVLNDSIGSFVISLTFVLYLSRESTYF